jgi:hypothetical protein
VKPIESFAKRCGTPLPERIDLLAVDPGASTGWAAFSGDRLAAWGLGDPPVESAGRIAIELPQVYPRQQVPPNDLIALAFLAGRYAGRARGAVSTVLPHQWKGNMPKDVCAARVRARLSPEERAVVDACDVPDKQRHNVLDAIGIGLFALGRL